MLDILASDVGIIKEDGIVDEPLGVTVMVNQKVNSPIFLKASEDGI